MIATTALRRDQRRGRGTGLRRPEKAGRGCEPVLHFKIHKKRLRQSQWELNIQDRLDKQLPSCSAQRLQVWTRRCTNTMLSTSTSHRNPHTPHAVDNADWLKTVAIISVSLGHFGYFFVVDERCWGVFGRH